MSDLILANILVERSREATLLPACDGEGRHANGCGSNRRISICSRGSDSYKGRHRAICEHAFVQYRGNDLHGCGWADDDEPEIRCGFYRQHHATMAGAR